MEAQRVVVIQDASREVSLSAIRWALHGLLLKPGDKLTLLAVLHQVNNPCTLSFAEATKLMGYKSRVDSSMFGANQKIVDEEVARKKKEYQNNMEVIQISKLCEMQKIEFKIEVDAGPSPKVVASIAANKLKATWVILDRQMKKDKKYFLKKLSCGISRMKHDNNIEQLRGPKATGINKFPTERSRTSTRQITYDEMIPGSPEEEDLFSIELLPTKSLSHSMTVSHEEQGDDSGKPPWNNYWRSTSFSNSMSSKLLMWTNTVLTSGQKNSEATSSSEAKCSPIHVHEKNSTITPKETAKVESLDPIPNKREMGLTEAYEVGQDQEITQSSSTEDLMAELKPKEISENSICTVCKNRRPKIGWKREFTYAELQAATDGFSPNNFLFEGGFGPVFRGQLKNGLKIAVKQHKDAKFQGEKEFKLEVHALSNARHKNVVMLLGSCSEGSRRLLVYEYVCNGSLAQHLTKHSHRPLTGGERMKIALGASRGLNYLHENNIIHRDMRPNNILVTHDHTPLLVDFGLARTQNEADQSSEPRVIGTFGYLAPEYAERGKVSTKTDVYSFGVVLLELITGRSTTDKRLGEKSLVGWARPLLKLREYQELIDPKIVNSNDVHQLFWIVRVAEKCLSKDPHKRLSMDKVVSALECIMDGKTACGIEDISPEKSDSFSSIQESNGLQSYERTVKQDSIITELQTHSMISQTSGFFSSASSATISRTRSSKSTSSGSSSGSGKSYKNMRAKYIMAKSRSITQIHYGEMLN